MTPLLTILTEAAPEWHNLALSCLAVAVAAVLRGLTGFGFALAAVPLLSLFLPPAQSVAIVIALQVMMGFRDVIALRRAVDWPSLSRLAVGAAIMTPVGVALLDYLNPAAMRLVIAALVGIGLAMLLRAPAVEAPVEGPKGAWLAGGLSGLFGGLAAMAGPPAVVWFMRAGRPPAIMRASLMVFFFATSVFAAPMMAYRGMLDLPSLVISVIALPVLMLGTSLGGKLFARTSDAGYRKAALATLAAMALAAGLRGLLGLLGG